MRTEASADRIREFLRRFASAVHGPGTVFLTGGATALLFGWRQATLDLDLSMDPEPRGAFEAIARLKEELDLNVELASPADFLPSPPGWRQRCLFLDRIGDVQFFHYDPCSQALSKPARKIHEATRPRSRLRSGRSPMGRVRVKPRSATRRLLDVYGTRRRRRRAAPGPHASTETRGCESERTRGEVVVHEFSGLERGHQRDLEDVRQMIRRGLVPLDDLLPHLEAIGSDLMRFPAIDARELRRKVEEFVAAERGQS